jgi:hypothetical protein
MRNEHFNERHCFRAQQQASEGLSIRNQSEARNASGSR